MIAVDFGSEIVKWFDGGNYGIGEPPGGRKVIGLSSRSVFVKKAFYPVCKGSSLKKLILNDVSADMGVPVEEVQVAYCPIKKLEKGCEFWVFVEKSSYLREIASTVGENSLFTVDILGAVVASFELYGDEEFTLLDAGASKVAVISVKEGKPVSIEILRTGFKSLLESPKLFEEKIEPFLKSPVVLIGGGALKKEFRSFIEKKVSAVKVPEISPFGSETPLFFSAYGLYKFRKSHCRATFKEPSLFSSEFLERAKVPIIVSSVLFLSSLLIYTVSLYLTYLSVKRDFYRYKNSFYSAIESVLGEKVLAPEIQIEQKISRLERLRSLFFLDKPGLLRYLAGISDSIVNGITVVKLDGDISTDSFRIGGYADDSNRLSEFRGNLLKRFAKVNVDMSKEVDSKIKFLITVSGVRN